MWKVFYNRFDFSWWRSRMFSSLRRCVCLSLRRWWAWCRRHGAGRCRAWFPCRSRRCSPIGWRKCDHWHPEKKIQFTLLQLVSYYRFQTTVERRNLKVWISALENRFAAFVRKPNQKVCISDRKKCLKSELYSYKMEHPNCLKSKCSDFRQLGPNQKFRFQTVGTKPNKKVQISDRWD